jgi:hypothetical protein
LPLAKSRRISISRAERNEIGTSFAEGETPPFRRRAKTLAAITADISDSPRAAAWMLAATVSGGVPLTR